MAAAAVAGGRVISKIEVAKHNKEGDLWLIIHNKVYDATKFAPEHPGGPELLLEVAGRNATRAFEDAAHSDAAFGELEKLYDRSGYIGDLESVAGGSGAAAPGSTAGLERTTAEVTSKLQSQAIGEASAPSAVVAAVPEVKIMEPKATPELQKQAATERLKEEYRPSHTPSGIPIGLYLKEEEAAIRQDDEPAGKGPRKKVPFLGPGFSHMDWMRLTNSSRDLAGTKGMILKVTKEELLKHNKENDAWMCLRGKVYNVTPYLKFHPGGVEELMRAAGRDGTKLFDYKHSWVNAEALLQKCFVGYYVG